MTSRNVFGDLVAMREATRFDVRALRTVAREKPAVVTLVLLLFAKCVRLVADDAAEADVHSAIRDLVRLLAAVRDVAAQQRVVA